VDRDHKLGRAVELNKADSGTTQERKRGKLKDLKMDWEKEKRMPEKERKHASQAQTKELQRRSN